MLYAFNLFTLMFVPSEGCREYVVSPFLLTFIKSGQFARRREQLEAAQARSKAGQQPGPPEQLTWTQMRMEKLPDTAISSALTGSLLNYWWRK